MNIRDKRVKSVKTAIDNKKISFKKTADGIEFAIRRLELFKMITVQY